MKDKRRGLMPKNLSTVSETMSIRKRMKIFILHRNFVRNGLSGRTSARRPSLMKRNVVKRLRYENDTRTGLKSSEEV